MTKPDPKSPSQKLRSRMKKLNMELKEKPKDKESLAENANEWMDANRKLKSRMKK